MTAVFKGMNQEVLLTWKSSLTDIEGFRVGETNPVKTVLSIGPGTCQSSVRYSGESQWLYLTFKKFSREKFSSASHMTPAVAVPL